MKLIQLLLPIAIFITILSGISAKAADLQTCNHAAEKINAKSHFNLGSDGCNSYIGKYNAETVITSENSCGVKIHFYYGSTQVQCMNNKGVRDHILQFRIAHRINKIRHLCNKFGLTQTSATYQNNTYCE